MQPRRRRSGKHTPLPPLLTRSPQRALAPARSVPSVTLSLGGAQAGGGCQGGGLVTLTLNSRHTSTNSNRLAAAKEAEEIAAAAAAEEDARIKAEEDAEDLAAAKADAIRQTKLDKRAAAKAKARSEGKADGLRIVAPTALMNYMKDSMYF